MDGLLMKNNYLAQNNLHKHTNKNYFIADNIINSI
jgi:hypothetical protein